MIILIGLIVSIALSLICFISTQNLITTAGIGGLSLIYFSIYANKVLTSKNNEIIKFQFCYQFINNFLIALSIKGHISGALASALESQNDETIDMLNSIESKDPMEKIKYLKEYFNFDIYSLFLDLINLYNEEGGEILQMSQYLLNKIHEDEEYLINAERLNQKALIEFSMLWIFTLLILIVLKFALNDFFAYVVKNNFYQIAIFLVLFYALISVHIAIRKTAKTNIKGI